MSITKSRVSALAAVICLLGGAGVGLTERRAAATAPPAALALAPVRSPQGDQKGDERLQHGQGNLSEAQARRRNFLRDSLHTTLRLDSPVESALKDVLDHLASLASPPMSARDPRMRVTIRTNDDAFRKACGKDFDVSAATVGLPRMSGAALEDALGLICTEVNGVFVLQDDSIELTTPEEVLGRPLRRGESRVLVNDPGALPWPADWTLRRLAQRYNRTIVVAAPAQEAAQALQTVNVLRLPVETAIAAVADGVGLQVLRKDNAFLVTTSDHARELTGGRLTVARPATRAQAAPAVPPFDPDVDPDQTDHYPLPETRRDRQNRLLYYLHTPVTFKVPKTAPLREMIVYVETVANSPESSDHSWRFKLLADHEAFRASKGPDFRVEDVRLRIPVVTDIPLEEALATLAEQLGGMVRVCPGYVEFTTPESALGRPLRRGEPRVLATYRAGDWPVDWSLRWLERRYGRRVSVSPLARQAAKGRASVHLVNVPFETAVELVAEAGGLRAVRQANALLVTTPEDARKLVAARKADSLGAWEAFPSRDAPAEK